MNPRLLSVCIGAIAASTALAAEADKRFDTFPTYSGDDLELLVDGSGTHFFSSSLAQHNKFKSTAARNRGE